MKKYQLFIFVFLFLVLCCIKAQNTTNNTITGKVWPVEKARQWYKAHKWISGSNFIPSTAINQLEMWQASTFDPVTINKELNYAENIGFNTMRVFLHSYAWKQDPEGFKKRIDKYLEISYSHGISTMFVFFDDCWNPTPKVGKQPEPKPGIHNSGWVQDPGYPMSTDSTLFQELERYMKDIMNSFAFDKRILLWDLYNEPGNSNKGNLSIPLLSRAFQWAHETKAMQPVTSAIFDSHLAMLNKIQIENSDIITYHNYGDSISQEHEIDSLKKYNRPLICSEYMVRTMNSTIQSIMPILKLKEVGAINWGFVRGKTNTIYAWNDTLHRDGSEPKLWFHDIFRKDGMPYRQDEINLIRILNSK